jgi:hypothetical protein
VTRSLRRSMCAGMLVLQAVVLFLSGLVMTGLTDVGFATALTIGLGLALGCIVTAGLLRRPIGYWLGWGIQLLSVGLGFVVPMMFFLGVVFAALWVGAYVVGTKIDRENAERAATGT